MSGSRLFALGLVALAWAGCSRSEKPSAGPEPSASPPSEKPAPPEALAPKTGEPPPPEPSATEVPAAGGAPSKSANKPTSVEERTATERANRSGSPAASAAATRSSSAPAAASAAPVVTGAPVAAEAFSVHLQARASYRRDQPSSVQAVLVAKDPFHCNEKYPYKFTLDAPAPGIKYDAQVVRDMSIAAKRSMMTIPFVATAAGPSQISGELAFSVCTESKCLMEKRRLSVRVNVE